VINRLFAWPYLICITKYRPGGGETICPPADGSSTVAYRFAANQVVADPKIAADLRLSADESAVAKMASGG